MQREAVRRRIGFLLAKSVIMGFRVRTSAQLCIQGNPHGLFSDRYFLSVIRSSKNVLDKLKARQLDRDLCDETADVGGLVAAGGRHLLCS